MYFIEYFIERRGYFFQCSSSRFLCRHSSLKVHFLQFSAEFAVLITQLFQFASSQQRLVTFLSFWANSKKLAGQPVFMDVSFCFGIVRCEMYCPLFSSFLTCETKNLYMLAEILFVSPCLAALSLLVSIIFKSNLRFLAIPVTFSVS